MNSIPLLVPDMPDADAIMPYLRRIDAARWHTNFGPLVVELEVALAQALGNPVPHVTTVANCTVGLELSLAALGLEPGAKVLVPALTFVASATSVMRSGFVPVMADVNWRSWLLTPEIARDALKRHKLRCVIPVATFGCPHRTEEWDDFCRETGVPVVIDAAGAFGNQSVGELAKVVFSFHATKSLGLGEGGLVAGRDADHLARVRQLSNFGIDMSRGISTFVGTNAKMSEYHAAVGLAALSRWFEMQARRRLLIVQFAESLREICPEITLQDRPIDGIYTIMQVLLPDGIEPGAVAGRLRARGIQTRTWYLPLLGMHPAFSNCLIDGGLPILHAIAPRMLGLPFHLDLGAEKIETVCRELSGALSTSGGN